MYHQLFAAVFVITLIGHQLATAAPTGDRKKHHHRQQQRLAMRELEQIINELDEDTTIVVSANGKVTEIYPHHRELMGAQQHDSTLGNHQPHMPGTEGAEQQATQEDTDSQPTLDSPATSRRQRREVRRRSRRSAAFLLHATMRWCDRHPITCKVHVQRDNVDVTIIFAEQ